MSLRKIVVGFALSLTVGANALVAQAPARLTLDEAKTTALSNHPHVLSAQSESDIANQQVIASRAPYYPVVSADITGTAGNSLARVGAGALSATRLFNRFGQGVLFSQ